MLTSLGVISAHGIEYTMGMIGLIRHDLWAGVVPRT